MNNPTTIKRKILEFDSDHLVIKMMVRDKENTIERVSQEGKVILAEDGSPKLIGAPVGMTVSLTWDKVSAENLAYGFAQYMLEKVAVPHCQQHIDNKGTERSFTFPLTNDMVLGIRNVITLEEKKAKNFLAKMAKEDPEAFAQMLADIQSA